MVQVFLAQFCMCSFGQVKMDVIDILIEFNHLCKCKVLVTTLFFHTLFIHQLEIFCSPVHEKPTFLFLHP